MSAIPFQSSNKNKQYFFYSHSVFCDVECMAQQTARLCVSHSWRAWSHVYNVQSHYRSTVPDILLPPHSLSLLLSLRMDTEATVEALLPVTTSTCDFPERCAYCSCCGAYAWPCS